MVAGLPDLFFSPPQHRKELIQRQTEDLQGTDAQIAEIQTHIASDEVELAQLDELLGELAPGLEVPRVLTGLWQVADMERDGGPLDPDAAARALGEYADAGFDAFDMADHYGSAEIVAGHAELGRFLERSGNDSHLQVCEGQKFGSGGHRKAAIGTGLTN